MPNKGGVSKKARARSEADKIVQKEMILDKAKELFLRTGREGFSLRALARELGMAPSNIYNYFSTKRELWFAVVMREFESFERIFEDIVLEEGVTVDAFRRLAFEYLQFGFSHPDEYWMMFVVPAPHSDGLGPIERGHQPRSLLFLKELVVKGLEKGLFKDKYRVVDVDSIVFYFWSVLHGAVLVSQSIFVEQAPNRPFLASVPSFFEFVIHELLDQFFT